MERFVRTTLVIAAVILGICALGFVLKVVIIAAILAAVVLGVSVLVHLVRGLRGRRAY